MLARSLLLLALCGLAAASSSSGSSQNYTSIQPPTYTVNLAFTINGVAADPVPCTNSSPGSTCLPDVSVPERDSITISWSGPAGAPGNTISLMTCFSNSSAVDRAWRKYNAVISKDKKCNVEKPFAKGLPTGSGSYTWTPGVNTPGATYNIQLLEVVNGSSPTTYAAMGKSPGFFVLTPIDPRPSWLMALVGVFCCIGPLTLAGFFYVEKIYRKQK